MPPAERLLGRRDGAVSLSKQMGLTLMAGEGSTKTRPTLTSV